jgi:hypothetical protein
VHVDRLRRLVEGEGQSRQDAQVASEAPDPGGGWCSVGKDLEREFAERWFITRVVDV